MSTVTSAAAPAPVQHRSLSLARLSDELLARQAARGSDRAFAALYERYHQALYGYCRSIIRNDADAQDVLQSTFTAALSALRRDKRNAPLRPWLYRIAHNEAISLLRRRSRESDQEITEASAPLVSSAEEEAAGRARWSTLVEDLAGLPERQRSALLMRELSGLSHEEIATALGTNVGGAKQAIFEARQGLMELAEGRAMTCEDVRRRLSAGDRRVLRGRRVSAHLRACGGCAEFAAAIGERRAELRAFAPVLPAAAATGVLARTLHAASVHGGSGAAAGSAAATAGAVGKVAGTALTWKALTGVALVAAAAAGATGIEHALRHHAADGKAASQLARHHSPAAGEARATGPATGALIAGPTRGAHRVRVRRAGVNAHGSAFVATPGARAAAGSASTFSATRHGNGAVSHPSGAGAAAGHAGAGGQAQAHGHAPMAGGSGHRHSATHHAAGSGGAGASGRGNSTAAPTHTAPPPTATTPTATTPGKSDPVHVRG